MKEISKPFSVCAAAIHELINSHTLIEKWLRGDEAADAAFLEDLLSRFHPHFSVSTAGGECLDTSMLRTFFNNMHGCKPELKIELANIKIIHSEGRSVWISYQ